MTAPTFTSTEAGTIDTGWKLHQAALLADWGASGNQIGAAVWGLHDALELHSNLLNEVIHPGAEWPELEHDDDAYSTGLRWAAEVVAEKTDELARLLPGEGGNL